LAQQTVKVPIAGKVISVEVKEGDAICILESMKIEHPILAPVDGTITQMGVTAEQIVKPGDLISIIDY
jgi:biotin carboxyl carrier protein